AMGVALIQTARGGGHTVTLEGPVKLRGIEITVPGDFSSAAFFMVAGCIGARDGRTIGNVGINPTRTGLMTIVRAMGADIEVRNERNVGAEPVADLLVRQSALRG